MRTHAHTHHVGDETWQDVARFWLHLFRYARSSAVGYRENERQNEGE